MSVIEKVNAKLLGDWIARNEPKALEKLSVASLVSESSLRSLLKGRPLRNLALRKSLSAALGVEQDELFLVTPGKRRSA